MSAGSRLARPLAEVLAQAPASWRPLIEAWQATPEGRRLAAFIAARQAAGATIYPATPLRALELTPRDEGRVVIVGQDPYHGAGQAEGLAFSVPAGVRPPPSLRNIAIELARDGLLAAGPAARLDHLGGWARQGVLLLNTVLSVEEGRPASHAGQGWEALTDVILSVLADDPAPKVFMLWGAPARAKAQRVDRPQHLVLQSNHPSPLAARRPPLPFIGNGHFGAANRFLARHGGGPIDWAAR